MAPPRKSFPKKGRGSANLIPLGERGGAAGGGAPRGGDGKGFAVKMKKTFPSKNPRQRYFNPDADEDGEEQPMEQANKYPGAKRQTWETITEEGNWALDDGVRRERRARNERIDNKAARAEQKRGKVAVAKTSTEYALLANDSDEEAIEEYDMDDLEDMVDKGSDEDEEEEEEDEEREQREEDSDEGEQEEKSAKKAEEKDGDGNLLDCSPEAFRKKIAEMPLKKVMKLKEKIGIKLFNKIYFGEEKKEETGGDGKVVKKEEEKKEFKRDNKHRPREISSKKRVGKGRNIYQNEAIERKTMDPRFDERCGQLDEYLHGQNYGFIDDLKDDEIKAMRKQMLNARKGGNYSLADSLKEQIRSEMNRKKTKADREMRKETIRDIRKENIERMKQGLAPQFKKRGEIRAMNAEKKFAQLKKTGGLDKYMARQAKKQDRKGGVEWND